MTRRGAAGGARPLSLRLWRLADRTAADLPPAAFALVMATGIVSIAGFAADRTLLAMVLFALNSVFFAVLWGLTILRLIRHRGHLLADLGDPGAGVGFFTVIAGLCVFGLQLAMLAGLAALAGAIWLFAICLWFVIGYGVFFSVMTATRKPSIRDGLSGLWLLAVVATQAIAVLGSAIGPRLSAPGDLVLIVSLLFFLIGAMLYILIIALIFFRLSFVALAPSEMAWPYWINMGATAITTQAGALLIIHGGASATLAEFRPFLLGFTLFFWAAGTWWIPLLIALGIWAHAVRRVPLRYGAQVWGIVFPLGMYAVSTGTLIRATGLVVFDVLPPVALTASLVAWLIACAGLARRIHDDLARV